MQIQIFSKQKSALHLVGFFFFTRENLLLMSEEMVYYAAMAVLVEIYDWMSYLHMLFKKIPRVKTYDHFQSLKTFQEQRSATVFFI